MSVLLKKRRSVRFARRVDGIGVLCLVALAWLGVGNVGQAQNLRDVFTNRITFTSTSGDFSDDNSAATVEAGEPKHGGKPGGHSVWISWVAPTNGVVRFRTGGSTFDTLLSAYTFTATNGTTFADLREVARADDSEGLDHASKIEFGVQVGERYEIAVDGYFGATGEIRLRWTFDELTFPPPQILSSPADRAVNLGETVTLSANVTNVGSGQIKWYFNGNNLNVSTTNLTLNNFQPGNVGRYTLRVSASSIQFFSVPTEIQINTEGSTNTLAQAKLLDTPGTPLIGEDRNGGNFPSPVLDLPPGVTPPPPPPPTGVERGYNGSQVFNTTYATADPDEPAHCGVTGGSSYWLIYQPPANGTITLDTIGSGYDTVMEAYTYNGPLNSYADLISIACDDNGAGSGGASQVQFPVVKSRQYVFVVEGVNGATGVAWLNYKLNTNNLPLAPTLLTQPSTKVVTPGTSVTLAPSLIGAPPLHFAWKKNETTITNATLPFISLPNVTPADTANYIVTVTNDLGTLTATLPLHVVPPPLCVLVNSPDGFSLQVPTLTGLQYFVEQAASVDGPWSTWTNSFIGNGELLSIPVAGEGAGFFRIRVE